MNKFFRHTLSLLAVAASMGFASSCDSLTHDDLNDCPEGLVIQLTPKYAARSSFEAELTDVHIFIYDSDDVQVSEIELDGEQLAAQNYTVTANVPVGNYRILVWNGLCDKNNYTVNSGAVKLNTSADNSTDNTLTPLWHGAVSNASVENLQLTTVTVPMVKDTNNFVIFLCTTNGDVLSPDEFDFKITAANGSIASDNSLLTSPTITYNDFVCREDVVEGSVDPTIATTDDLGMLHMVRSELNTMRLTPSLNSYLSITQKSNGKNIITINLIDYILKAYRSDMANNKVSDDVYLDTEDLFNLTFFLTPRTGRDNDEPTVYYCAYIKIRSWILRYQELEITT